MIAFRDINPQAPYHFLFIPKRHVASMAVLGREDGALLASLFIAAQKVAQDNNLEKQGYRFVTNVGSDAGQSVFHLHFHLLGGRIMGWPPG